MTQRDPGLSVRQMLDFARKARDFGGDRTADEIERDPMRAMAVLHAIELMGEAASRVPEPDRLRHPRVPWSETIRMRNRLAHGYDSVDYELVVATLREDIPPLIEALEELLREFDGQPD